MINRALVVDKPWIDMILDGKKTWEMRTKMTRIRGRIGLIKKGSGLIVGECDLVDSLPKQSMLEIAAACEKHLIHWRVFTAMYFKWHFPWVLEKAQRYEKPISYKHPQGAVTWVKVIK